MIKLLVLLIIVETMYGLQVAKDFFLLIEQDFGSRSPAMHNAAFAETGLPHVYSVCELEKAGLEDISSTTSAVLRERLRAETFGGASVTIPHKQVIMPFLDELSDAAKQIGAVNTVIPSLSEDGRVILRGDNTDWLGVCAALEATLLNRKKNEKRRRALLVGSGGTARAAAYALTEGGRSRNRDYELYLYARDSSKAQLLADAFNGHCLSQLDSKEAKTLYESGGFDVIVSTIPGDAHFSLPDVALDASPAVLDVAYKPAETALLIQALERGCPVAQGATMLLEQGIAQFELWTGLKAPRDVMRAAVFKDVPVLL